MRMLLLQSQAIRQATGSRKDSLGLLILVSLLIFSREADSSWILAVSFFVPEVSWLICRVSKLKPEAVLGQVQSIFYPASLLLIGLSGVLGAAGEISVSLALGWLLRLSVQRLVFREVDTDLSARSDRESDETSVDKRT